LPITVLSKGSGGYRGQQLKIRGRENCLPDKDRCGRVDGQTERDIEGREKRRLHYRQKGGENTSSYSRPDPPTALASIPPSSKQTGRQKTEIASTKKKTNHRCRGVKKKNLGADPDLRNGDRLPNQTARSQTVTKGSAWTEQELPLSSNTEQRKGS